MQYEFKLLRKRNYILSGLFCIFFPGYLFAQKLNADTLQFKYAMPAPSGKYGIGTNLFFVVDSSRFDSTLNKTGRNISFQLWYPSTSKSKEYLKYIPTALRDAMIKDEYNNIDPLTLTHWEKISIQAALTNSIVKGKKFPILFFLHGFGMSRYSYISIIQSLVSEGYIVVSMDSPHSGLTVLPDGQIINTLFDNKPVFKCESMAKDVTFVMNWLQRTTQKSIPEIKRSIDFTKAGVLGHSLGGAAALETCRTDNRFAACIDLDGDSWGKVEEAGLNKPTLILLNAPLYKAERFKEPGSKEKWDSMGIERKKIWQDIFQKNEKVPSYAITISGANHFTFTDFPFVTLQYYRNQNAGIIIEKNRGLLIISSYIKAFFDRFILLDKSIDIKTMPANFPETNLYLSTK